MPGDVEVSQIIEAQPVGARQLRLLFLCLAITTVDGFDAQIMGYVAPKIAHVWNLSHAALGSLLSAGLFGLMLGALALGTLGDRVGRKTVLLLSTLLFSGFSIATALATSPAEMLILRFLTGIGLGGAMPAAIALVSEYAPQKFKATATTITTCGFALGPAIGGFVAAPLISRYGWASVFYAGGAIPLAIVPILYLWLPESSWFLVARGVPAARVARNLRLVFSRFISPETARYVCTEAVMERTPVRQIFADRRATATLLLWAAIFLNLLGLNLLTNWLPLVITGRGFSFGQALTATAMFHVGGVVGGLALGQFVDRLGAFKIIPVALAIAGLAVAAIGSGGSSITMLRATIFAAGLFVVGGQTLLNALSGIFYPNAIRATGSGWALGVGRLGAVVGPIVGAFLITHDRDLATLFIVIAAPFALGALAIALMGRTPAAATPGVGSRAAA